MFSLSFLTVLLLLSCALALPHHPQPRAKQVEGSCKDLHLPTEADYTKGWQNFCSTYKPLTIEERDPLDFTYNITAYDGKVIEWIYRIEDVHKDPFGGGAWDILPYYPEKCGYYFDKILSDPENGGLGKSYCVVDGTGGDWFMENQPGLKPMSGEGVVLVMGGKEEPRMTKEEKGPNGKGFLSYQTRKKKGT